RARCVLTKDALIRRPRLGRRLVQRPAHREEQLGRLQHDLIDSVDDEPERDDRKTSEDELDAPRRLAKATPPAPTRLRARQPFRETDLRKEPPFPFSFSTLRSTSHGGDCSRLGDTPDTRALANATEYLSC